MNSNHFTNKMISTNQNNNNNVNEDNDDNQENDDNNDDNQDNEDNEDNEYNENNDTLGKSMILNILKKYNMEPKTNEALCENKTLWDYPGYSSCYLIEPSPWRSFGSHLDDEGYCQGQWDGYFSKRALIEGIPCGIIPGNGNKDKIEEILRFRIVKEGDELYGFLLKLLQASNSYERIKVVKKYLEEKGMEYDDERFSKIENGRIVKSSFFKSVIFPLIQKTPGYLRNQNKR